MERSGAGSASSEVINVRTAGSSDGTTTYSCFLANTAIPNWPDNVLKTPEIVVWNDTVGSSITVELEYLHDVGVSVGQGAGSGNAFQNNEVFIEVHHLGNSSFSLGSLVTSAPTVLGAASDNATGVGTGGWVTTDLVTPKSGKCSVTFTPQKKGYLTIQGCLAKASKQVTFDTRPTVTGVTSSKQALAPGMGFVNELSSGGSSSVAFPPVRIAA
jgi:hypothetical protein